MGADPVCVRAHVNMSAFGPFAGHHCSQGAASPPVVRGALHGACGFVGTDAGRTMWWPKMLAGVPAKHGKMYAHVEEPGVPSHAEQPAVGPFQTHAPSEALM